MDFTLHELACFDAVVTEGSFQAAAQKLHRTHPAIHTAVKHLESRLGVALLDRDQYRVQLTEDGKVFHRQTICLLQQAGQLRSLGEQLQRGEETDLRVIVGDLTPVPEVLRHLKRFFKHWPRTRLHLHFDAIGGPWERLLAGEADLIVHHIDKSDSRFEWTDLTQVTLVPVAAPTFLGFPVSRNLTPEQMRSYVQVIIRDTAQQPGRNYFVIQDAPGWTVGDQHTKKELILQGMGWGHMPLHLVEKELRSGKLISLEGRHFKRSKLDIVAAWLRGRSPGPVALALRDYLAQSTLA